MIFKFFLLEMQRLCGIKNQAVQGDLDLFPSVVSRYKDGFAQLSDIKLLLVCIPPKIGKEENQ